MRIKVKSVKFLFQGLIVLGIFAMSASSFAKDKPPNIVIIWGDDIGQTNVSAYSMGVMGYQTPNIDRVAKEGMMFTDYYAEQSCTAGRASFITGQSGFRTGLLKVGLPTIISFDLEFSCLLFLNKSINNSTLLLVASRPTYNKTFLPLRL